MNKKTLAFTLGGAMVTVLAAIPMVHAQENPFGLQAISNADSVATADDKMKEGKCGEAKCGAAKAKMKESADAMPKETMKDAAGAMPDNAKEGAMPAEKMNAAHSSDKM